MFDHQTLPSLQFPPRLDATGFRRAMSHFATGVTIATTLAQGDQSLPAGVTINSFTSVSLDPPMILFCLGATAGTHDAFIDCEYFAINMLSAEQQRVSDRFARACSWPWRTQWQDLPQDTVIPGPHSLPILRDSLAWLICRRHEIYPAGDHHIIIGLVERAACSEMSEAQPALLYYGSRYRHLPQEPVG